MNEPLIGLLVLITFKTGMDVSHLNKNVKAVTKEQSLLLNVKINKNLISF